MSGHGMFLVYACARYAELPVEFSTTAVQRDFDAELPVEFSTAAVQHDFVLDLAMSVVPTVQALADTFRVNQTITRVDLRFNNFGDEGLKAPGTALGGCRTMGFRGEMKSDVELGEFCDLGQRCLYEA